MKIEPEVQALTLGSFVPTCLQSGKRMLHHVSLGKASRHPSKIYGTHTHIHIYIYIYFYIYIYYVKAWEKVENCQDIADHFGLDERITGKLQEVHLGFPWSCVVM